MDGFLESALFLFRQKSIIKEERKKITLTPTTHWTSIHLHGYTHISPLAKKF